jgi:hypothetical protein
MRTLDDNVPPASGTQKTVRPVPAANPEWALHVLEPYRVAVVERVRAILAEVAQDHPQLMQMEKALPVLRERALPSEFCPGIHLALLTCMAAGGEEAIAVSLAAATLILEISADMIDSVWDEEVDQLWPGDDPRLIEMVGMMLMAGVTPQALAAVPTTDRRKVSLQTTAAARLLRVAAGEMLDVQTFARSDVTMEEITLATLGKTGERRAVYAVLGAIAAGAPARQAAAYDEMGRFYGYARQIASDVIDLDPQRHSRDLASGSKTWPIAWMLCRLEGSERERLAEALAHAGQDPEAAAHVRRMVQQLGAHVAGAQEIEAAIGRAKAALGRVRMREPAATLLAQMLAVELRRTEWIKQRRFDGR